MQVVFFEAAQALADHSRVLTTNFIRTTYRVQKVTTILKITIDPSTPASVRVLAAECVLNHAAKAIEIEDIEARLAALERAANVSKDGRR
jgi:hypothetical protein